MPRDRRLADIRSKDIAGRPRQTMAKHANLSCVSTNVLDQSHQSRGFATACLIPIREKDLRQEPHPF